MPSRGWNYAALFGAEQTEQPEDIIERLRSPEVIKYRTRTIRSGPMLEAEVYPIWAPPAGKRAAKAKISKEAQQRLNHRNAQRRLIRKLNTNFGPQDLCVTLTYRGGDLPDQDQARRDVRNYLRRVRAWRKRQGLPELKYLYVMEHGTGDGRRRRVHHHIVMSAMDRDVAEELWGDRGYANCHRLQPDDDGLEALGRYLTKEASSAGRWACSKNLKEPVVTESDTRISRRRVEYMARDLEQAPEEVLQKVYPGYGLRCCEIRYSDIMPGAYIYARLRRDRSRGGRT